MPAAAAGGAPATSAHEPSPLEVRINLLLAPLLARNYGAYIRDLGLSGTERILDFGSGAGTPAKLVARRLARGGGHLTCLDVSRRWLEVAARRLRRYGNVDLKLGEITDVGLPPSSYDAVFIHFALHEVGVGAREAVVRTMAHILKPGGAVFVREPVGMNGFRIQSAATLFGRAGLVMEKGTEDGLPLVGLAFTGVFRKPGPAA